MRKNWWTFQKLKFKLGEADTGTSTCPASEYPIESWNCWYNDVRKQWNLEYLRHKEVLIQRSLDKSHTTKFRILWIKRRLDIRSYFSRASTYLNIGYGQTEKSVLQFDQKIDRVQSPIFPRSEHSHDARFERFRFHPTFQAVELLVEAFEYREQRVLEPWASEKEKSVTDSIHSE
jgi:hypothetical protein